jgi:hypothetical protein
MGPIATISATGTVDRAFHPTATGSARRAGHDEEEPSPGSTFATGSFGPGRKSLMARCFRGAVGPKALP